MSGNSGPLTEYWVFGYGSLIWNPGFPFQEAESARLFGYHRKFCLYSIRYRGTEKYPGLVLGLDRGGCCSGRAFRVAAKDWPEALAYLDEREIAMGGYFRRQVRLQLPHSNRTVSGITYVINRDNPRYVPNIEQTELVTRLAQAAGPNGTNRAYLTGTVEGLEAMGLRDPHLNNLLAEVSRQYPLGRDPDNERSND